MAKMGGGATWLICCHVSHYLQSWGNGWTRNPLCLVAASEYRATTELVEISCMATMGCAKLLICCQVSHELQSWGTGWTRKPLSVRSWKSRQSPAPHFPHCWAAARERMRSHQRDGRGSPPPSTHAEATQQGQQPNSSSSSSSSSSSNTKQRRSQGGSNSRP